MPYSMPGNLTSVEEFIVYESSQIDILMPMILTFVFFTIAVSGHYSQERRVGRSNIAMWFSVAGLVTSTGAIILFLYPGIVNLTTVIISVVISFVCALWALFSGGE